MVRRMPPIVRGATRVGIPADCTSRFVKVVVRGRVMLEHSIRIPLQHLLAEVIRHWRYSLILVRHLAVQGPVSRLSGVAVLVILCSLEHLHVVAGSVLLLVRGLAQLKQVILLQDGVTLLRFIALKQARLVLVQCPLGRLNASLLLE